MKKLSIIILAIMLVSALSVIGSGATGTAAAAEKVYTFLYTDHNPGHNYGSKYGTEPLLNRIEEASNGRIKIERYYGQTLAKGTDAWSAVLKGVADIGWCFHGYWPGMTPLSDAVALPFVKFKSARQASGIFWRLWEKYPEIQREYVNIYPIVLFTTSPYHIITTKKQVKTLEDLKGMKLRIIGGPPTDSFRSLGASPMMVAMSDCYTAMQKGVLDGMGVPIGAVEIFNFYEVIKYLTDAPLYVGYFSMAMNKDKFDALPPDLQQVIRDVGGYKGSRWYAEYMSDIPVKKAFEEIAEFEAKGGRKVIQYTMPDDQYARIVDIGGKPIWDAWVKKMKDKGLPGRAVLDEMLKLVESESP